METKHHFQNECIVSGILGVVIRLSQIFGVASIRVDHVRNNWCIRVSQFASFYSKVVILIMFAFTATCISWDIMLDSKKSSYYYSTPIYAVMFVTMAVVISSALLVQAFSGITRMESVISNLDQIQKISAELSVYTTPRSPTIMLGLWTVWSIVGGFVLLIIDYGTYLYHINSHHENYYIEVLYISHYAKYVMLKVLTTQITLIFTTVLATFNHLNDCLDKLVHQMARKTSRKNIDKDYPDPSVIHRLGYLYCCLCEVVRKLDKSHALVLVPIVGSFLLHLVVTPYNFITKTFGIDAIDLHHAVVQIYWLSYHVSDVIMIFEPCHRTQTQTDRVKQLISQLLRVIPPENKKLMAELELFYKYAMVNDATYAPFNLFILNRALLLTIIGSVTTYLVVVIKL